MKVSDLVDYFTKDVIVTDRSLGIMGMEIETMFTDVSGAPITMRQSQRIFAGLLYVDGWRMAETKGKMITKVISPVGDTVSYELGRHNLEVALRPAPEADLLGRARNALQKLYLVAREVGACPAFWPTMAWPADLLAIPDERDTVWLELDGRETLNILAKTASVQFMVTVAPESAVTVLNNLGQCRRSFLDDYPQDTLWREYIADSHAGYQPDRFGGPAHFESIEDYCCKLAQHDVVTPGGLIPFSQVEKVDISLYLRSVWWYFRLRRFGSNLCVEIRPLPRRTDADFANQLQLAKDAVAGLASRKSF